MMLLDTFLISYISWKKMIFKHMFTPRCYIALTISIVWYYSSIFVYARNYRVSKESAVVTIDRGGNIRARKPEVNHWFTDEHEDRMFAQTTSDLYRNGYQQTDCLAILSNNVTTNGSAYTAVTDEQRLTCALLYNYDKYIRPVMKIDSTLVVNFSFSLGQIFDLDDHSQVLIMNVWFEQQWTDEFLRWNHTEYNNLGSLNIPAYYIFIPDIELYNTAADYTKPRAQFRAMVSSDGKVFYGMPAKILSNCHINPTWYPFDTQICHLKFGSWTHSGFLIDLQPFRTQVDTSRLVSNGKWQLLDIVTRRHSIIYTCCPEPYVDVTFYLILKRRSMYYIFSVYFYTCMLIVMSTVVYKLPVYSREKIALGAAVLFSVSVFMLSVAQKLPESSDYVPIVNIYLFIIMGMSSLSIVLSIGINAIHYRHLQPKARSKEALKIKPVPKHLMYLVKFYRRRRGPTMAEAVERSTAKYLQKKLFVQGLRRYQKSVSLEVNRLLAKSCTQKLRQLLSNCKANTLIEEMHELAAVQRTKKDVDATADDYLVQLIRAISDIYFAIDRLANAYEAQIDRAYTMIAWHELAEFLDAVLFWCFVFMTISAYSFVSGIALLKTPSCEELLQEFEHKHDPNI